MRFSIIIFYYKQELIKLLYFQVWMGMTCYSIGFFYDIFLKNDSFFSFSFIHIYTILTEVIIKKDFLALDKKLTKKIKKSEKQKCH